ncbi:DUF3089 domain-containing protein [Sphingomonas arenae]|uniref:DUF3089 domain-containing protein n=1 Tax=Sphingomonas arenae TaxID=2812555 RepID=UPI00196869C8|nr:DUF3089 domain-containing protein [Sphingomonas arenae]
MWIRRFLMVIFALTILVVVGAFAVYQFGGEVLKKQMTPQGQFQAPPPQSGPDYAQQANWIAKPGLDGDPSSWLPEGAGTALAGGTAAIFYIHPTTYLERDRWNGPMDDPQSRNRAELFVRSQASAFSSAGQVWAPRYRQAAFGAFLLDSRDARSALDLAYRDVARAFERFLQEVEPNRPIILAGHSQGALHLTRLLKEKVAGQPVATRVVAAYVVGWPVSAAADLPAMGLPPCRTAEQAGCVLSWQSFGSPANTDLVTDVYDGSEGFNGQPRRREDMLCVNPLTGTRGGSAPPAANLGTLVPDASFTSATLAPGQVGAGCEGGFLIIDGEVPPLGPYVLPGNNYHVYDYALFWANIRQDAQRRLAAWRR